MLFGGRSRPADVPIEDLSTVIGDEDNTLIRSISNKFVSCKSDFYSTPGIKFEGLEDCYQLLFVWNELVAFSYVDDILPLVNMVDGRIKDFEINTAIKEDGTTVTIFVIKLIKEAHLDSLAGLSKRKRNVGSKETNLPVLADIKKRKFVIVKKNK